MSKSKRTPPKILKRDYWGEPLRRVPPTDKAKRKQKKANRRVDTSFFDAPF